MTQIRYQPNKTHHPYAANSTLSELSLEDELILDDVETSELKKKKRSIVALASRMKQARESRKQRKSNVENDDIRNNGNNNSLTTNGNKSQMNRTWIEKQEQKLKQHKAMLASVHQETHRDRGPSQEYIISRFLNATGSRRIRGCSFAIHKEA